MESKILAVPHQLSGSVDSYENINANEQQLQQKLSMQEVSLSRLSIKQDSYGLLNDSVEVNNE